MAGADSSRKDVQMSSNTPGYPGGFPNYPPQPDQGYGPMPTPSYGSGGWPPSAAGDQRSPYGTAQPPARRPEPAPQFAPGGSPNAPAGPRSRRGLWIGLAMVVTVLLLLAGGAAILNSYQTSEAARPMAAANAFCQVLKTQDY